MQVRNLLMCKLFHFLLSVILAVMPFIQPIPATAQDARVQQAMRNMTTRLRTAETERDNLQAAKAQSELRLLTRALSPDS